MTGPRTWIAALRRSHERLDSLIGPLSAEQLSGPSYCSDWHIAQVLSHLGSGAEIFGLLLEAAATGRQPPGLEAFEPIWATWNARSAPEQAASWRGSDTALVARFESFDDAQLAGLRLAMFGMDLDAVGLARMRLSEHAVHTWDVAVALDPAVRLAPDAVDLLAPAVGQFGSRFGRPQGERLRVGVHTTAPALDLLLDIGETVALTPADGRPVGDAQLRIPAEALIRLLYGRLDPAHTPADVTADGVDLDVLRKVFPGF
jgi:uncharacterized protein (TIGR03083 family)